jgi:signal transduction histidine kinase
MTNKPRRILIIEDDSDGLPDLRKMILCGSNRRYEFSEAELGSAALKQMQENTRTPFDCILLEYHLPDLEAQEMLAAICDGRDLPPCPIVVLTGSDREVGKELLRGGAQDYLGKGGITPESLTRAIGRFAILEVSRITTGRVQLRQERIALRGIVDGAVETARPLIDQRKHELSISLPQETLWLNADAARLEQVVVNLLTNAAKYTEEKGHIWLSVRAEGDECVLRVCDTGVGIAPALLPKIFDLFTRAERSLDRSQGGLGIGLALVQRLTGYGQDTDRELSTQAGFNHHLVKPARLEQVKEILAAAAEQRKKSAKNRE